MPYVTPADPPGEIICIRIYCPEGYEYEAALRGAVFDLTLIDLWENVDGQTEEVVSQAFLEAWQLSVEWRRCMPVGAILFFAAAVSPDGFLACDGASYDTGDYSLLFDVIGYVYGGSGANFNVPDLRDSFPLGAGGGVGVGDTGGQSTVTLAGTHMPNHDHDYGGTTPGLHDVPIGLVPVAIPNPIPEQTSAEGGGNPHENMPPYVALLPVISYR